MLRVRGNIFKPNIVKSVVGPAYLKNDDDPLLYDKRGTIVGKRRTSWRIPLPLILIVVWCAFQSTLNFRYILDKNLGLLPDSALRARTKLSSVMTLSMQKGNHSMTDFGDVCPPLPDRLARKSHPPPLIPITKDQVDKQREIMTMTRFGTMGDTILQCPAVSSSNLETECRGVLKIYRSRTVYEHVKRTLTILADTGIVPRVLYSDDTTNTLVEESMGEVTMMNSPIPVDFDEQLRRIFCILRQHKVVHRDVKYTNIVINDVTGMLFLIDFGDAFLGTEGGVLANLFPSPSQQKDRPFNWRNMVNLINILIFNYDEERVMEDFIAKTRPKVLGRRQWRPKPWKFTSHAQMKVGTRFLGQELLH